MSLLSQFHRILSVDVDSMDPNVVSRFTTATEKFQYMTSNQAIVHFQAITPDGKEPLQEAISAAKAASPNATLDDALVTDIHDRLTVLLAKRIYPYLTGNVLVQSSPDLATNTQATVAHAKRLVELFELQGIPKERVCIKIPMTPQGALASSELTGLGIQTLGTALFSVAQALAASQARCICISPYLTELRAHFESGLWKEYDHFAQDHPMAAVIRAIIAIYERINSTTQVMPASVVNVEEVIGIATLRPHRITIPPGILEKMSVEPERPGETYTRPPLPDLQPYEELIASDLLAHNAVLLEKAIEEQPEVQRKLSEALSIFSDFEKKTKDLIRSHLQE